MLSGSGGPARPVRRRDILRAAGAAICSAAVAATLAGCSGDRGPGPATADLKFVDGGDAASQDRMRGYLAALKKGGGPSVDYVPIGQYYTQNVEAMVAAGVPPDAVFVSRTEFDALWPSGKLADLSAMLASGGGAFFPLALQEWQRNNQQLALPLGFRTLGMVYNLTLFQTNQVQPPPTTWTAPGWSIADFATAAGKMSHAGTASQGAEYGFYVDPTYPVWSAFVLNNGGTVIDEQRRAVEVDQPAAVAALAALQGVMRKPGVVPPEDLVAADGGTNLFSNGTMAMTITDPSTIPVRQRDAHFPWDAGVLPGDGGERVTTGTGAGYAILAGSKHADAAWKLISDLTGEAVQRQEAPYSAWIPSRPAVANSAAFIPELNNVDLAPQHKKVFVEALSANKVHLQPALKNWSAVRDALEAGIQGLWTGQLQPAEAAAQMKKLADPILQRG